MPSEAIKKRRKRRRQKKADTTIPFYATIPTKDLTQRSKEDLGSEVEVEYVVPTEVEGLEKPEFSGYTKILQKFNPFTNDEEAEEENEEMEDTDDKDKEDEEKKVSTKRKKKDKRDKIQVLKILSDHPEIVEVHDVNSPFPWLLVYLKSYRNTVPVPRHWCQRRKYLQGKRGIEKAPFELPDFIRNTGICDIRQAVLEKEESQKVKQQARDRLQPKMGKIDIDYQVLYDAFFSNQTKPPLTGHSDLYYEGKEYEVNIKERKPGHLSKQLRVALGMPEEGFYPPPWLVNMQRNGPPPAYPHLRIPGLNAPTPPGAKPGFHAGGWGQPPTDAAGRPLFGAETWNQVNAVGNFAEPIEANSWGILEDQDESDEEYENVDDQDDEMETSAPNNVISSQQFESGTASVGGYETPESIDLRKQKQKVEKYPDHTSNNEPKQLYQELKEEQSNVGNSMFGSQHRYVIPKKDERLAHLRGKSEKMNVSLNPGELMEVDEGITEDLIRKKYDDTIRLEKESRRKEDMSDLVAADSAKRKRKESSKKKNEKAFRF